MDLPSPYPPRPDTQTPIAATQPPSRSSRWLVLIAAIVTAVVGTVAVVVVLSDGGDGFPGTVLGYERLHGEKAEAAEDFMEGIRIADLEIKAAIYGDADAPRLMAVVYGNYPTGVGIQAIVDGMSLGMEQSGGSVDEASLQMAEGDGYRFACVEASGPGMIVPGGPDEDGVACVFQGAITGLVVTTHSSVSIPGLQDVRAFVDAYEAV